MKIARISVVVIGFLSMILGSVIVGSHIVWSQEPTSTPVPTATATSTPTATPTVDPEVQATTDRTTLCLDSVHYYYLSRTGIELEPLAFKYAVTDSGAEVTGTADADDERLTGIVNFKCVFEDFMDVPLMLTDVEVTEGE